VDDFHVLLREADALRIAGKTEAAIKAARTLNSKYPQHLAGHLCLADTLVAGGHFAESVEVCTKAAKAWADEPLVHMLVAIACEGLSEVPKALIHWRQAYDLGPHVPRIALGYAACLRRIGEFRAAAEILVPWIKRRETDGAATLMLLETLDAGGFRVAYSHALDKSIRRLKNSPSFIEHLARLDPADLRLYASVAISDDRLIPAELGVLLSAADGNVQHTASHLISLLNQARLPAVLLRTAFDRLAKQSQDSAGQLLDILLGRDSLRQQHVPVLAAVTREARGAEAELLLLADASKRFPDDWTITCEYVSALNRRRRFSESLEVSKSSLIRAPDAHEAWFVALLAYSATDDHFMAWAAAEISLALSAGLITRAPGLPIREESVRELYRARSILRRLNSASHRAEYQLSIFISQRLQSAFLNGAGAHALTIPVISDLLCALTKPSLLQLIRTLNANGLSGISSALLNAKAAAPTNLLDESEHQLISLETLVSTARLKAHYQIEISDWGHLRFAEDGLGSDTRFAYLLTKDEDLQEEIRRCVDAVIQIGKVSLDTALLVFDYCRLISRYDLFERVIRALPLGLLRSEGAEQLLGPLTLATRPHELSGAMLEVHDSELQFARRKWARDIGQTIWVDEGSPETMTSIHPVRVWRDHKIEEVELSLSRRRDRVIALSDACILNNCATVVVSPAHLVEETINCDPARYIRAWPDVLCADESAAVLQRVPVQLRLAGRYVLASYSRDPYSYAHWILDVLARILLAERVEGSRASPILSLAPLSGWQKELLDIMGIAEDRLVVETRFPFQVQELVLPMTTDKLYYSPAMVAEMRRRVEQQGLLAKQPPWRRIFVGRSGLRGLVNGDAMKALLAEHGFENVSPERMTVREQIRMFSEAAVVVAAGGAALTNVLFMQAGSNVVSVSPNTNFGPYFAALAHMFGVNYSAVLTDVTPEFGAPGWGWASWRTEIPPQALKQAVEDLLRDQLRSAR